MPPSAEPAIPEPDAPARIVPLGDAEAASFPTTLGDASPASHTVPARPPEAEAPAAEAPAANAPRDGEVDDQDDAPELSEASLPSQPILDVRLDPSAPLPPVARRPKELSPQGRALAGLGVGLGLFALVLVGVVLATGTLDRVRGTEAPAPRAVESEAPPAAPSVTAAPPVVRPEASAAASAAPAAPVAGPWRVASLAADGDVRLVRGTIDRRAVVDALIAAGVPKAQVYRLLAAFASVHRFDKTHRKDVFVAALANGTKRVRAFEYEAGPAEVYQAREQADGTLTAQKLDLHVETREQAGGLVLGDDAGASFRAAGFEPTVLDLVDDALEGRVQLSSLRPGARFRILAEEESVLGAFARYSDLEALEYSPPSGGPSGPLRIYHFKGGKAQGYFDAKGHQPSKGGWRSPIPFARISSRFDLHRMHPVLHVVKPHNGVDFAASTGTPVYAASSGHVLFIGDSGPSGNLVTLEHAGGITTGYAHLSRFAPHLSSGDSVEARQLIGYVGSTGRSTGPHLHFCAKRNGVFIDPLTLKLDGERILPKSERGEFDKLRAELDTKLDALALPAAPESAASPDPAAGEPQEDTTEDEKP